MEYEEEVVSTRNEVIRLANRIILEMRETGKKYTIVWGDEGSIKFMKEWNKKTHKPERTDMELRKDIVNFLKGHYGLGKPIK